MAKRKRQQKRTQANRFTNPLGLVVNAKQKTSLRPKASFSKPPKSASGKRFVFNRRKFIKWALIGIGVLAVLFVGMVVVFSFDLPTPGQIAQYKPTNSTKIYDRNGKLIWDISGAEKRTVISSSDIPKAVKDATVSIEDRGFYSHHGVYLRSILRALYIDISSGSKAQGGSTITQQLVRNAIDTVGKKKSFIRKVKEVILAVEFERVHTKDEILTMYLNEISYGGNNNGIESAAVAYYGVHAKDLNPDNAKDDNEKAKIYSKIATLVALPQSPTTYNPYGNHTDLLDARRRAVLRNMVDQGYLSQNLADKAKAINLADDLNKSKDSILAPHFAFYVREQVVDLLGGGQTGEQLLSSGGYKITTTLDLDKQKIAEDTISKDSAAIFKNTGASNTALVSIDAKTGQIIAMVGSVDFGNKTFGSVNVTTSSRQPGSSFKPIVYATLFKKGWSPGSTIFDLESTYDQSHPNDIWPHDYSGGGRGPVKVREALAQSLNISAVKAQGLAGTSESINTAKDLGISTLGTPDKYGLSMVLGAAEVKMTDMVGAYSTFDNGGVLHPVSSILKIEDNNGQVVQEWKDQPKNVLDPNIAYEITSILSDNDARTPVFGAHSPLILPDRAVAAKTGTTSSYRDAWTIGFTPQYVTAVWVGNNNNKEMTHSGAGAMAAAPIWHDYMVAAHQGMKAEDFNKPDSIKNCSLSRYSNKKPTDLTPSSDVINDICADWQVPTTDDDTHKTVKLYKPDHNILATDATPPSLIDTQVFVTIHSERPNDPVWEKPVLDWASGAGINASAIPTNKYDPSTANDKLTLSILSPADNSTVYGNVNLRSMSTSPFGVSLMTFYVDDKQVAQPNAPWTVPLDTTTLTDGKHTFKAVAHDLQGQEQSSTITFTVNNASAVAISNVSATRSADKLSVTITWQTSVAADGLIQYGPTISYGTTVNESKGKVLVHTLTVTGLDPLVNYHYRVGATGTTDTFYSSDLQF